MLTKLLFFFVLTFGSAHASTIGPIPISGSGNSYYSPAGSIHAKTFSVSGSDGLNTLRIEADCFLPPFGAPDLSSNTRRIGCSGYASVNNIGSRAFASFPSGQNENGQLVGLLQIFNSANLQSNEVIAEATFAYYFQNTTIRECNFCDRYDNFVVLAAPEPSTFALALGALSLLALRRKLRS